MNSSFGTGDMIPAVAPTTATRQEVREFIESIPEIEDTRCNCRADQPELGCNYPQCCQKE